MTRLLSVAFLLLTAWSCRQPDRGIDRVAVRDSAGVRITTIEAAPDDLPEWLVETPPLLVLDGQEAPYLQRVTSGAWLSDESIVLLDRQADQLQLFDREGRHVRSFGRSGDGPGEFGNIATVTVAPGDSIFVFDRAHDRVSIFHPTAGFVRDVSLRRDDAAAHPIDVWAVAPGRFVLFTDREDLSWLEGYDGQPFVGETQGSLTVHGTGGERLAGPLSFPGGRYAQFAWGSGGLPLSPGPAVAGATGRIVLGIGEAWEITVLNDRLEPAAILRWPGHREAITEADRAEVRQMIRTTFAPLGADRMQEVLAISLSEDAVPVHRPAHGRIVVGNDGRIWVSRYEPYDEETVWFVVDPDGRPEARVRLPERARLLAAEHERVLYVLPDSLDLQSVYVSRVGRP